MLDLEPANFGMDDGAAETMIPVNSPQWNKTPQQLALGAASGGARRSRRHHRRSAAARKAMKNGGARRSRRHARRAAARKSMKKGGVLVGGARRSRRHARRAAARKSLRGGSLNIAQDYLKNAPTIQGVNSSFLSKYTSHP